MLQIARIGLVLLLLALLATTSCPKGGSGLSLTPSKPKPAGQTLDLRKTSIGLPSVALDYIGTKDFGLAGAKKAGKVFFAVPSDEKNYEIYSRDLVTQKRDKIATVEDMQPSSLTVTTQADVVVYSRGRTTSTYIDIADVQPIEIAIPYRMDVGTGKQEALFDFREPEWMPYRSPMLTPMMSHSGKRVAALSFDFDENLLTGWLQRWLDTAEGYFTPGKMKDAERSLAEKDLRKLLVHEKVKPLLGELGVAPAESGPITATERDAIRKLFEAHKLPHWALLLWDDGTPKLIKLRVPDEFKYRPLTIGSVGDDLVTLAVESLGGDGMPLVHLLRVDLQTGEATPALEYSGAPSSMALDGSERNLVLIYNPFKADTKQILGETHVRIIPLDGGAAQDRALPADLISRADTNTDGTIVAGQDRVDQGIYITSADGKKTLLSQRIAPIESLFLTEDGKHIACTENGFLFALEAPDEPEKSQDWVDKKYFVKYDDLAREFLGKLGYTLPESFNSGWEESESKGLEINEANGLVVDPAHPEAPVLLRYDTKEKKFVSVWFPSDGTLANPKLPQKSIDPFGADERAIKMLDMAGWLSDKRQKYQPSANPLFDTKSHTYLLSYRDGYMLNTKAGQQWVVNGDATLRVNRDTGQVIEMNLREMPEVKQAEFKVDTTNDEIPAHIRNESGPEAHIPGQDQVRFDLKKMRLIVARDKKNMHAPAPLAMPDEWRICYEVDGYILPENELILTSWVDVETGKILGTLNFLPTNQARQAAQ